MAIGRLQASWFGMTNEVSLSAAQLNFDFTLVKCEAPKEYHQLGEVTPFVQRAGNKTKLSIK